MAIPSEYLCAAPQSSPVAPGGTAQAASVSSCVACWWLSSGAGDDVGCRVSKEPIRASLKAPFPNPFVGVMASTF